MLRISFSLFFSLLLTCVLTNCLPEIRGEFGWTSWDSRNIPEAERKLHIARKFKLNQKEPHFRDYESIWWIYRITSGFYFNDKFLAALYEDNYSPQPILTDMREASLLEDASGDYIRYYYEALKAGVYLLRIAYDTEVIDEARFFVSKAREEPLPLREEEEREEDEFYLKEESTEEIDEIEYYSRGNFSSTR